MIARAYEAELEPQAEALPRITRRPGRRAARGAAERRRARTRSERRRGLSRLFVVLFVATVVGSGYLALLGNVMWMQLQLDQARDRRAALQVQVIELDDRLAHAESRDNLLRAAAELGMHDPASIALVTLPKPPPEQPKPAGIAFFGTWLH